MKKLILLGLLWPALAFADNLGDMRRDYNIVRDFDSSGNAIPKFDKGLKAGSTVLSSTELESLAASVDSATVIVTGITAGTTQTQAGATALTGRINNVTTVGTAGDGVKLPTAVAGLRVTVRNSAASNTLKCYPATSDNINALAVNLSVDIPALTEITFFAIDATTWYSSQTALYLSSPTTLTGGLQIKAAASAGNTTTLITNASQAAARTYTIPDAGGNALFGMYTTLGTRTASQAVTLDSGSLFNGTKLGGWDYALTAAGSAFAPSSASAAKMNSGSYTIAANRLLAGGTIEFEVAALVGAINATDTFTLDVRLGGTDDAAQTVFATRVLGATTAANDYVTLIGKVNVRAIGASGSVTSLYTSGGLEAGSVSAPAVKFVAATTKDTTAALYLSVVGKWSTSSATNSATLQVCNFRVVGN